MTCTTTETLLTIVRDDLRTLRTQTSALENENYKLSKKLEQLREDHDSHIKGIAEERRKREHRRSIWGMVLMGIIWVIFLVSLMIPIK